MQTDNFIIDLHCHPNLKSFNSGHPVPTANLWDSVKHDLDSKLAKSIGDVVSQSICMESQCNLDAMSAGNVRIFNISLYPTERGFLHLRNLPTFLVGKRRVDVAHKVVTGYDETSIAYQKKNFNYFEDLQREYEYINKQQGKSPDGKSEFVLVNSFTELEKALKKKNTMIGIISIEGGHVLGTGTPQADKLSKEALHLLVSENIRAIKQWEFPPFSLNVAHHFWNHLCGHSTSFKRPMNRVLNQVKGKNKGITELGWHVIRELLSTKNGKRIVIDTKHMSIASRKEYYDFVHNYNFLNPDNKIPIISSHACANGFKTMDASIKDNDIILKARKGRLYKWSINISDEEARIINESGGLIGLMMDKGNLGGIDLIKEISTMEDKQKQRTAFIHLFWDNVFQLVKAVNSKSGWDSIAFGSDYDGSITHINTYPTAASLPTFQQDLIDYLEEKNYQKELWFDYSPQELVAKIMQGNAMRFYSQYFV